MKATPYIYVLCNKLTGDYYIGSRRANEKPAIDDFMKEYFTSSHEVHRLLIFNDISNFSYVTFDTDNAVKLESVLLEDHLENPKCLNKMRGMFVGKPNENRPLCIECRIKPAGINYWKNGKAYFRKKCDSCIRQPSHERSKPWERAGYKLKDQCEKCGYKSNHAEQFNVFHIDGDLTNCKIKNLKTVCANCQRILHKENIRWKQGDLIPDMI